MQTNPLIDRIRNYWNIHIHDLEIVQHSIGSEGFFRDLEEYRFDKLRYLSRIIDFSQYKAKKVLEIGCGAGIDLIKFAQAGAGVTGIDLSKTAIDLAEKNFKYRHLPGTFKVMNGEAMDFKDHSFDVVYVHGVIQYTADGQRMVDEAYRVLKPGGEFIGMVYNRKGWLNWMSKIFRVKLEHEDAPVLKKYSISEFRRMLDRFSTVRIVPERFPVKSRLHRGIKGFLFNTFFIGLFQLIPKPLVKNSGWHIMAFAIK